MSHFLTIGIGMFGGTKNSIFLRVKAKGSETVSSYDLNRDEARELGRALICYSDLADELDKPEKE